VPSKRKGGDIVNDYDHIAEAVRDANPWPDTAARADGEWSMTELLSQIEHRSGTVDTIEKTTTTEPTGPKRDRGWWLAAAVAALVVLIGAVIIGLSRDSGTDVVEPTPTTLSAPTTVAATTAPATTLPPATTTPPSTTPPTTTPATTVPPQAYEASMTWDGENCTYEGPTEARVGDTLTMTFTNNSDEFNLKDIGYLIGGATREDLVAELGTTINLETFVPPASAISWHPYGRNPGDGTSTGPLLQRGTPMRAQESSVEVVELGVDREFVFVCNGGGDTTRGNPGELLVDVAEATLIVTE
jgi:hypothetical protein